MLEYAQKLISTEGTQDGLFWETEQGDIDEESPGGAALSEANYSKAKAGEGYFGYHYRILTSQGANIAGGQFDYIINGNMIAGFGLVAWPVKYGETGIHTFVVSKEGIIYEADLGENTEKLAADIAPSIQAIAGRSWAAMMTTTTATSSSASPPEQNARFGGHLHQSSVAAKTRPVQLAKRI